MKHILILPDGREISSGVGSDPAIRSLTLTEMVNAGPELTLGSCCSDMLEVTLFTQGDLPITTGDALTLWKEEAGQRVKLGLFTVETPTRLGAHTMKLTGFDNTAKLDRDLTAWLDGLTGWPYGLMEFAELVCMACNLDYIHQLLPNRDFLVEKWSAAGVTGRQILQWIGQIAGRFAHADPNGCIRFDWYRPPARTLAPQDYFSLSYENFTVAPIDTVQLRLASNAAGLPWPPADPEDNAYVIADNPILGARVTEKIIHYLDTIHTELADLMAYTPCTVTAPADPTLGPGQSLEIQTAQGPITMLIMEKTSNGWKDTYRCTGSQRRSAGAQQSRRLTQQEIFQTLTGGVEQGLFLQDGKVYLNAEYLKTGAYCATGQVFLDPGFPEAQAIRNHLTGVAPLAEPEKYDFNGDGEVTVSDMLLAQKCALGQATLKDWPGAQATPVTVTVDPANAQQVLTIRGANMWGREVEYSLGFGGSRLGRLLGDVTFDGRLLLGSATVVEELPATAQPGQLILLTTPTESPWKPCQCYIGA